MTFLCNLRRRVRRALITLGGIALIWGLGLIWFAETMPREAPPAAERTDAIVVLTGGSDRVATGIDLLSRGLGAKLFVSGVHRSVDLDDLLRTLGLAGGEFACCIVLGHLAGDTVGNAAETAAWVREQGFRSLRLVTANYHMRRSLLEFRTALPDVAIIAHPVAPESVRLAEWWRWPGTLSLITLEYNKYLVALARYWAGRALAATGGGSESCFGVTSIADAPACDAKR